MKISATGILAIAGLAGGAYLWSKRAALKESVNPLSDKNVAYQGANTILQTITGNKVDSVGTAIANVFPSKAEQAVAKMLAVNPPAGATTAGRVSVPMQTTVPGNAAITINPFELRTQTPATDEFLFGLGAAPRSVRHVSTGGTSGAGTARRMVSETAIERLRRLQRGGMGEMPEGRGIVSSVRNPGSMYGLGAYGWASFADNVFARERAARRGTLGRRILAAGTRRRIFRNL